MLQILAAGTKGNCGNYNGLLDTSCLSHAQATNGTVNTVLSIIFAITASIALLMIVIGGFRYIISRGDPNGTSRAKDTIVYSIIGLLVSMTGFAIVTFVIKGIGS